MTRELEKKFYDAFGIPTRFYTSVNMGDLDCNFEKVSAPTLEKLWEENEFDLQCSGYWLEEKVPKTFEQFKKSDFYEEKYPEITDRILLELICLLDFNTRCDNVETLKEKVLTDLRSLLSYMRQVHHIPDKENDIYKKVRAVFGLESEGK